MTFNHYEVLCFPAPQWYLSSHFSCTWGKDTSRGIALECMAALIEIMKAFTREGDLYSTDVQILIIHCFHQPQKLVLSTHGSLSEVMVCCACTPKHLLPFSHTLLQSSLHTLCLSLLAPSPYLLHPRCDCQQHFWSQLCLARGCLGAHSRLVGRSLGRYVQHGRRRGSCRRRSRCRIECVAARCWCWRSSCRRLRSRRCRRIVGWTWSLCGLNWVG